MWSILRRNYVLIFSYLFFAILTFGKLPFTFFLQDEWLIIGTYLRLDKADLDWLHRFFIYKQLTHLVPFAHLVSYAQFELFRLNFFLYGASAIIIHLINTILVYYLSSLLLKKRILSFIAGFLFLTSSISHQGFTWIATTIGTSFSTLFLLLSLIFFTKYITKTTYKIRYLILSAVFLAISILFKEISIFAFIFLPVFWFIYKRNDLAKLKMILIMFVPLGVLYMSIRIINLIMINLTNSMESGFTQPGLGEYAFRIFALPLRFISQGILPQEIIIKVSSNWVNVVYPFYEDSQNLKDLIPHIAQSVGADIVSFFFAVLVIIISIIFILFYKKREQQYAKTILLSLVFISLSSFPFILVPGKAGFNSLIDGRHLYTTEIFTSILLAILTYGVYLWLPKKKLALAVIFITVGSFIFFNVAKIRSELHKQVGIGFIRKSILNTITGLHPKLPERAVFYIESDKAYYGLAPEEKILPFQSGFGQTLLVWYESKGHDFPSCMYEGQYLYDLLSEGYRECEGRGFGYFRKMEQLKRAVKENKFPTQNINAFTYDSSSNSLTDITTMVRDEFKK